MKKLLRPLSALGLATALAAPAHAESTYTSPASTGSTARGRLDISIVIPQVLFLRVGISAGNPVADVDATASTAPAANAGDASAVAGVSGDLTAGAVTVRVYGNSGNVSLSSATTGAFSGNSTVAKNGHVTYTATQL